MGGFLYVTWDMNPTFFSIGSFEIRLYGAMWALALLIGMWFFSNFIKREKLPSKMFDSVVLYGALATIIGARLGHCLFYDPVHYLSHPLEILKFRDGGMASHGAAVGLLLGLWLFSRKYKIPYIWSLDRIMVPVAIGGAFVRLGNLFNSEIYGGPTDMPWGFIFVRAGETVPKHPTQIYEALCYLITFAILAWLYYRRDEGRKHQGLMFGVGLIGVFLSRFFIEFIKNPQEKFEVGMALDMGQWLSIPFILLGIAMIIMAYKRPYRPVAPVIKPKRRKKK
jgi:prolipoprotein diacylglyceryl transferase